MPLNTPANWSSGRMSTRASCSFTICLVIALKLADGMGALISHWGTRQGGTGYVCVCAHVCMCVCVRVYMSMCMHVYMCTCVCVCACVCVCVCVCISVYKYVRACALCTCECNTHYLRMTLNTLLKCLTKPSSMMVLSFLASSLQWL